MEDCDRQTVFSLSLTQYTKSYSAAICHTISIYLGFRSRDFGRLMEVLPR